MTEKDASIVIGTAGHIDHGKSALVRALTGYNPDRLAEEKRRGITIELGFAKLDLGDGLSVGLVDVPGHERFVRQMIAGASGIDAALLAIAADDGIMPQTREHLAVLRLLHIPALTVAVTKCDLVDEEWAAFVDDEVRALLAGTPYADADIVNVSSVTGEGLEELKGSIARLARAAKRAHGDAGLRMPIDRAFSIHGAGTVVTGTLWSGQVSPGDAVQILPAGRAARVRAVQIHDAEVQRAQAGHRVAINLAGVGLDEVAPGDFIAAPDARGATDRFDADVTAIDAGGSREGAEKAPAIESGGRVRVAHGTKEVFGRVLFFERAEGIAAGQTARAQIRLDTPLPVRRGDRFVLRALSPVRVIGGGRVLAAHPRRRSALSASEAAVLDALSADDVRAAGKAYIAAPGALRSADDIAEALDLTKAEATALAGELVRDGAAVRIGAQDAPFFATRATMQSSVSAVERALLSFHAANPHELGMTKEALHRTALPHASDACFDGVLAAACDKGGVVFSDGIASHATAGAAAAARARERSEAAFALIEGSATPPSLDAIAEDLGCPVREASAALGALAESGRAVRIDRDLFYDAAVFERLAEAARAHIAAHGPSTAADLKDAMGLSRKYAIPVLEAFDARGITKRDGDRRI